MGTHQGLHRPPRSPQTPPGAERNAVPAGAGADTPRPPRPPHTLSWLPAGPSVGGGLRTPHCSSWGWDLRGGRGQSWLGPMCGQSSRVPPTLTCVVPIPQPKLSQARSSARHSHQHLWSRDTEGVTSGATDGVTPGGPQVETVQKGPRGAGCAPNCATEVGAAPQAMPSPLWRCAQHSSVHLTRPHTSHHLPGWRCRTGPAWWRRWCSRDSVSLPEQSAWIRICPL